MNQTLPTGGRCIAGWSLAVLAVLAGIGCGTRSPVPDRLPEGSWGGEHVDVTAGTAGVAFQFDCAHGKVDGPIRLEADGAFSVPGSYVRERGGPVGVDETEQPEPAVYAGRLQGVRLTFSVRLTDSSTEVGPFAAVLSARPNVFRCL